MPQRASSRPQLLLATNNPGKVAELRALLEGCGWEIVTPQQLGIDLPDEETGRTYAENAAQKALRAARASGLVALADDSGLEIEVLDGAPGIESARFLGREATYDQRFAEILRRLAGLPRAGRQARFVCVMAVADPGTERGQTAARLGVRLAEGEVRGLIAEEPRGEGGFGYDPIFWVPQQSATMAELPAHQKGIISHRARAAAVARQILKELLHEHRRKDTADGSTLQRG
ncbi:MAG: RdgB/HAM1 family non-canonical purine NTP pyrophosphatase [Dehalococcoidia bacterium]|nr:RdgB/HAM1 family non-canonical purine NTP pyrophosphatase [Dehalococcoidia bacterium]